MMTEPQFAQVAYMPYAPIRDSFRIGNYEIWPYDKESGRRIENQDVIQHLNRHFGRYFERAYDREKGGYDKPLEEIVIISPADFQFGISKFSEEQIEEIRTVNHIIAFSAINEHALLSSSSDAFVLHTLQFEVGSNRIRIWNKWFAELEMVKFMKPYHLDSHLLTFSKTALCDALGDAFQFKSKASIRKIFRTLELFFHTATRGEMVTNEHRLLSLVMCFEVMLDFRGKMEFAKEVEEKLDNPKHELEKRIININGKHTDVTFSKIGWWAFDLYDLRNDIVHGNKINWDIEKYGDIRTRIKFGGALLRILIKTILSQESLWHSDFDDSTIDEYILEEMLESATNKSTEKLSI